MGRTKASPFQMVALAANVLVVVAIVAVLYLAQDVFIPITLSTLLAFLLAPIADRLEAWGLSRIPAVLAIAAIAFTIIGALLGLIGREATRLAADMPRYQNEIVAKVENFSSIGSGTSKRMTEFVTAISQALRGNKPGANKSSVKKSAGDEPNTIGSESSEPPAPEADPAEREAEGALGSATNPIHTIQDSNGQTPVGTAFSAVGAVLNPLTNVGLVIVFTIFILLSRDDLRDRIIRVLSGGRYIVTTKAIDEASRRISSYILAQTIVNSLYGVCIGAGLWLIGVTLGDGQGFPNFALWGLLCTILRFIPYLGPIIAGAFPVMLSLIVYPGFSVFLATALLFAAIELSSNNVIEPWLYGSSTGMSAMAVIVAAVFWTWMWGPVGLLLAVPLTSSLVVMGKHVPQLRPLTVLLGDRAALPPSVSYYQRLLADDHQRAEKIFESAISETDLETAADDVLLPTIRRVRRDRASEELSAPREHRLMQLMTTMIDDVLSRMCPDDLKSHPPVAQGEIAGAAKPEEALTKSLKPDGTSAVFNSGSAETESTAGDCAERVAAAVKNLNLAEELELSQPVEGCEVFGCTAHHESEELVLKLLTWCLNQDDVHMRWTGTKALPSDVEAWVQIQQPPVIVIAIVPPEGFIQARYLCQRLHKSSPGSQIIIAYYGKLRSYDSMLIKFRSVGATFFSTSLSQTRTQVTSALERHKRLRSRTA